MVQDAAENYYLNDKKRIADLINGHCLQGRQLIHPEDIQEGDTRLIYLQDHQQNLTSRAHDLIFKIIRGINCIILGLEQQNYMDPSMVLRTMEYTVGQYIKQRHEIQKIHKAKKDLKDDEYLSSFSFQDLLNPVLILVLYFGDKEWKGARTLHELLDWRDIPDGMKILFADYQMQLIEVQKITDLSVFHSDFRLLFGFLQCKNNKNKLESFVLHNREELTHLPHDLFLAMSSLSQTSQLNTILKKSNTADEGGDTNMCKAIDDMIDEGRKQGICEGISRVNKLHSLLLAENRFEELKHATEDTEYQNHLFEAYAI